MQRAMWILMGRSAVKLAGDLATVSARVTTRDTYKDGAKAVAGMSPFGCVIDMSGQGPEALCTLRSLRLAYPLLYMIAVLPGLTRRQAPDAVRAGANVAILPSRLQELRHAVSAAGGDDLWTSTRKPGPVPVPHGMISRAQGRVMLRLAAGRTNPEIAKDLGISLRTVRCHIKDAADRLGWAGGPAAVSQRARTSGPDLQRSVWSKARLHGQDGDSKTS